MTAHRERIPFADLALHDSVVDAADYRPAEAELVFDVDLCWYEQRRFVEGDPELVPGRLVFEGVRNLRVDADDDGALSRSWWTSRHGSIMSTNPGHGTARLVLDARLSTGPEVSTCVVVDLEFDRAYFLPT